MEKEDAGVLLQLIGAMNDSVNRMENFYSKGDAANLNLAKEEVLKIQKKIDSILR